MNGEKSTFYGVFGSGGNEAGICLDDWQCESCGKDLTFSLVVEEVGFVEWRAACCGSLYKISPSSAAYNRVVLENPVTGRKA